MIRSMLFAAVSTVVLGTVAAMAADLPAEKGPPVYAPPPPPVFSWSGFYIGGQVGYEWGQTSSSTYTPGGAFIIGNPTVDEHGVVGGGHIGYNYQFSQFVLGVEGDVNGANYTGSGFDGTGFYYGRERTDVDASVRGRVGVAFDRVLIYGTGGAAFESAQHNVTDFTGFQESHTTGRVGWTVGGGIEYAIDNNWSVRAEYRYTDYGRYSVYFNSLAFPGVGVAPFDLRVRDTDSRVQVGFSYKFGEAPPPAPPLVTKY